MVQREAGERLVAVPEAKNFGAVSVRVAYFATAALVGRVPPGVFLPRPNVESVLVEIVRRESPAVDPAVASYAEIDLLVRAGFGGRQEDVAPVPRGTRRRGHLRGRRDRRPLPGRGARHRGVGQAGRMPSIDHCSGTSQADPRLAGRRSPPPTATTSSRPRWRRSISRTSSRSKKAPTASKLSTKWPGSPATVQSAEHGVDAADRAPLDVPLGAENLVVRALATVGRRARVRLTKRIPAGAGLGGGSADAAAVLRWAGARDPAVAAGLGADVPFCVVGGRALVSGIGEVVEPLGFEAFTAVLVTPAIAVSTSEVYRAWDALGGPTGEHGNDLEPAALAVEPRLAWWRDLISSVAGDRPRLAGSGGTWYLERGPKAAAHLVGRAPRRSAGRTRPGPRRRCREHRSPVTSALQSERAAWR